tara:strand:- start:53553 stop:54155 length:603 start_codon:yes stop_codon:yes gene_type:complete
MKKKIKQVEKYFSKVAIDYDKKSNSFPWDILRKYEKKKILSLIKYKKYEHVLELGSGAGYYTNVFLRFAKKIYTVDLSSSMLDKIMSLKVIKIVEDVAKLNLRRKFDLILCLGVLEFNNSYDKILKNIFIHSHKKTDILIMMPYNNLFSKFYSKFHRINKINLNIKNEYYINNILNKWFIIKKEKKIFPFSKIFICQKKK